MKRNVTSPVMTLKEAHRVIDAGVTYVTFWRWAKRGDLPTVTIGGKRFILREPFMKLFKSERPAA